jgi:TonB family protein
MSELKKKTAKKQNVLIGSVVGVFILCVAVLVFTVFFTGKGEQRKKEIQMITLLPPPPPPVDIPPPPKVEEKVEEQIEQPDEPEQEADAPPQELGVDAEAGLGDDFGLKARKGGQGLIGGQGGSIYGWYTNLLSTDLQKMVNEIIQKEGGLPDGKWRTVVKIELDVYGKIKKFSIIGSSGNQKMDAAVNKALASAQVNEPPPPGMPRIMKLSFTI